MHICHFCSNRNCAAIRDRYSCTADSSDSPSSQADTGHTGRPHSLLCKCKFRPSHHRSARWFRSGHSCTPNRPGSCSSPVDSVHSELRHSCSCTRICRSPHRKRRSPSPALRTRNSYSSERRRIWAHTFDTPHRRSSLCTDTVLATRHRQRPAFV